MAIDERRINGFLTTALGDLSSAYGGVMVALGHKLGLYKALAGAGPLTSRELAERTGCSERYVREWLNSQAAGGYVDYRAKNGSYELPPEHALTLADEDSPTFFPPAWEVVASLWFDEEKVLEAFRTGKGIPWGDRDARLSCGSAAFFRSGYKANLATHWIPSLDGVHDKLTLGATVADVGCGHGYSTIIMAESYPNSVFWGFDAHAESIEAAREHARQARVNDRVHFEVATAKQLPRKDYDLICFFDCLHDLGDPVGATKRAVEALADDGSLMLVEPFAHDDPEKNFNPIGRLYYAASAVVCCAHSLSEEVGLALGAQAGGARLEDVLRTAGFRHVTRTTETPFNVILQARL